MRDGASSLVWVALVSFLLYPSWTRSQPPAESCVACHAAIGDERLASPVESFANDIHHAKGFGCVSCHGGDPTNPGMEAMDPAKGYIGKPKHTQIIQVCGRCHSDARFMRRYNPSLRVDQVAEYYTSVHGQRLQRFGDPKVAVCVSCHSAHAIKPASDPRSTVHPVKLAETCGHCHADSKYMQPYQIPNDQLQKYQESVHWQTLSAKGDLSAPTCNDCHGNHGAAPPGISWVGNVCGQCHSVMEELFSKSKHSEVFARMGTPGCATCHGNHDVQPTGDEMVGLGDGAVCARCHTANDNGGKAAVEIRGLLDSLSSQHDEAHAILLRAERAGMEVGQAQFDLNGAKHALVKARAALHAFTMPAVRGEIEPGLQISSRAHAQGVEALEEVQFRRKGLAVSVVVIVALIIGLVLKIRQMERGK